LGDAVTSSVAPNKYNLKNFTAQFVGKRVGLFPDAANLDFMGTQEFKMMTGGDLVPIDEKYEKGYSRRLNCKFIVSSNHKPSLNGQKSDARRLIYYEMPEVDKPDPMFLEQLYRQREAIFCHCMDLYFHDVGQNMQIPVEPDQLDGVLKENSTEVASFFDKYFVVVGDGRTSVITLNRCIEDHFGPAWNRKKDFRDSFDLYVRREHKIDKIKPLRDAKDVFKGYHGFELSAGNGGLACNFSTVNFHGSDEIRLKYHRNQIEILERKINNQSENSVTGYNENPF
jgi:hypothetical protein